MKLFLLTFVCSLSALLLTGCSSSAPVDELHEFPWQFAIAIRYTDPDNNRDLTFETYADFLKEFEIPYTDDDLQTVVHYEFITKMFYYERTQTFTNPLKLITLDDEAEYTLVFISQIRRTSVTGNYASDTNGLTYNYYFKPDVDEIVIFDRFANQTMWYVCALGATALFMLATYLFLRIQKRPDNFNTLPDKTFGGF